MTSTLTSGLTSRTASLTELDERARDIFRRVVETYIETGEPVGSRALTRKITETLSPATIRNIMADLQDAGLLYAPHTSAGRLPTDAGLKLFVNGLLELGNISEDERASMATRSSGASSPISRSPSTKSLRPFSVGARPALVCGA